MTPLLDIDTGTLTFSNGLRLEALMAPAALSGRYATLRDRELFLEPCPVTGGTLAPVCLFQEGALVAVTLYVSAAGGRERPGMGPPARFFDAPSSPQGPVPGHHGQRARTLPLRRAAGVHRSVYRSVRGADILHAGGLTPPPYQRELNHHADGACAYHAGII